MYSSRIIITTGNNYVRVYRMLEKETCIYYGSLWFMDWLVVSCLLLADIKCSVCNV